MNSTTEKQLVPLETNSIGGVIMPTVDGHMLHGRIQSKREFANWVKDRIADYGYIEGEDFLTILSKSTGGRPKKEYKFTLEVAKELAMVEKTEVGRQVRRYFIRCEEELKKGFNMSPGHNSTLGKEMVAIAIKLPEAKNAFQYHLMMNRLEYLCSRLGHRMPDAALLRKPVHQFELLTGSK